jgi:hypothetical protein
MESYKMELTATKDSFIFRDGEQVRTLKCPEARTKQINNHYYYFDKPTVIRHGFYRFVMLKKTSTTSSILAKRLWEALWCDGWR